MTVWKAIKQSNTKPGDWILIGGAGGSSVPTMDDAGEADERTGGLGHLAIQYAAALSLRIIAVDTGAEKEKLCRDLGGSSLSLLPSPAEPMLHPSGRLPRLQAGRRFCRSRQRSCRWYGSARSSLPSASPASTDAARTGGHHHVTDFDGVQPSSRLPPPARHARRRRSPSRHLHLCERTSFSSPLPFPSDQFGGNTGLLDRLQGSPDRGLVRRQQARRDRGARPSCEGPSSSFLAELPLIRDAGEGQGAYSRSADRGSSGR